LALLAGKSSDLALLVERWDTLPEVVRAGIVAMVKRGERRCWPMMPRLAGGSEMASLRCAASCHYAPAIRVGRPLGHADSTPSDGEKTMKRSGHFQRENS
jgi:hypothetical protein